MAYPLPSLFLVDFPRPLVGRNLPEITGEFAVAGIDLSGLYDRVDIPLEWIGKEVFRTHLEESLSTYLRSYGKTMRSEHVDRAFEAAVEDDMIDVGCMDEVLQERAIRILAGSADAQKALSPNRLDARAPRSGTVASNRDMVLKSFGIDRYGEKLVSRLF